MKEKPRSFLSFGKSVHSALEYFFNSKFSAPPPIDDVFNSYKDKWIPEGYADQEEDTRYFDEGKRILEDFYNIHTKNYKRPLAVEYNLNFAVNGVKITGYIDRLDKVSDKGVEIVDYKTNKNPFSLSELREEPQLTMYQLGIEQEMGLRIERLTYYHLLSQTPFTVPRHGDEQVEMLKNRIVEVAQKIEAKEFPYCENRYCPCDFGHLCPLYMHNYKKDTEKEPKAIDIIPVADEYGTLKDQGKEISARIEALQNEIKEYMNRESIERVFGSQYEVNRSKTTQERLDTKKARQVLEENNLLDGLVRTTESESIRYKEKKIDNDK